MSLKCLYCLAQVSDEEATVDHVIPTSWHASVPEGVGVEPLKVQSCKLCNNRYSQVEGRILKTLGLTLSPSETVFVDVAQKSVRAANPSIG